MKPMRADFSNLNRNKRLCRGDEVHVPALHVASTATRFLRYIVSEHCIAGLRYLRYIVTTRIKEMERES